jgi:hypothetical protein
MMDWKGFGSEQSCTLRQYPVIELRTEEYHKVLRWQNWFRV